MSFGRAQEIPKGVRYKRASAQVNAKAKASLSRLLKVLVPDTVIIASLEKAVVCGPSLWSAIKKVAPSSLQKAGKVTFMVPNATGTQKLEGRFFKKAEDKCAFWLNILAIQDKYKRATIRKAKASELQYYWAIISYDIDEPLWVADYGKVRLLFHFSMDKGTPKVFFVDIVR